MKIIAIVFSALSVLPFHSALNAQSTSDLFSLEGLSINAYDTNYFDGLRSESYTVIGRTVDPIHGDIIKYISNEYGTERLLRIQGKKIYEISRWGQPDRLLYDFGVVLGYVFNEGWYKGRMVTKIDSITLLNGDKRKTVHIGGTPIVEGIGDLRYGLFPFSTFESVSIFVCAKLKDELLLLNPEEGSSGCEKYSCIRPIPKIDIITENLEARVINTSLYANDFLWDFGDGQTSTEASPVHVYDSPGCYNITLAIGNDCYQDQVLETYRSSIDFNIAWDNTYSNDTLNSSVYAYNVDTDYVYNDESLYKVTNQGQNWEELSISTIDGEKRSILDIKMWDEKRGVAGCKGYDGIIVTDIGGLTWTAKVSEAYWTAGLVTEQTGMAYAPAGVYADKFYRTEDFGQTWDIIETDNQIYKFLYVEGDVVYAQTFVGFWKGYNSDFRIGISSDKGESWNILTVPFKAEQLQFVDSIHGFGIDRNNVWFTEDGGMTWEKIPGLRNINYLYLHSPTHGWIINKNYEVLYTTDRFKTLGYSACGNARIYKIQTLSDTTAITFRSTFYDGTKRYLFNKEKIDGYSEIIDNDGDGFVIEEDCNDSNPYVNQDQLEEPYNGIDDDCNSDTPDDDLDQDGFSRDNDCDDTNPNINSDQLEEPYNGIDDDCNPATLDDDLDQDGFLKVDDCDDNNPNINPAREEIVNNGIDEDCDGMDLILLSNEMTNSKVKFYPNPSINVINLDLNGQSNFQVNLYSLEGKLILSEHNLNTIKIDDIPRGVYLLEIKDLQTGSKTINKIVVEK
ncbi:MAG: MopE-related protein [Ekhidna sp.]